MIKHTDIHRNKTITYGSRNERIVIKKAGIYSEFKPPKNRNTIYEYVVIERVGK